MYALVADIGGTNTTLAIATKIKNKPKIIAKQHFDSQKIKALEPVIIQFLNNQKSMVAKACLAGAGPVENEIIQPTNIQWQINAKKISKATKIKNITLLNDFEALGYAVSALNKDQHTFINKTKLDYNQPIAIIGAGTGLGKAVHFPNLTILRSQGGHVDVPIYNDEELKLINFIRNKLHSKNPLDTEDILSGRGITYIYDYYFLQTTPNHEQKQIHSLPIEQKAQAIAQSKDTLCIQTMQTFVKFYARCAKNFCLDTFSTGGLVIAGGIAMKNVHLFKQKEFLNEFSNHRIYHHLLKKIPITVITDYSISLSGAANKAFTP